MKVDKQKLAKHHFWILLGVFVVLAVVLLIVVPIGVGGQIEEKEKKYGEMSKKLDDAKNVKSAHYIAVLDDQKGKLGVQRERIHVDMFRRQRDLLAFPGDLNEKYKNKDFGSPVDLNDKIAFRSEEVYMAQYQEMAGLIKPTEFVPNWQSVLMPIEWDQSVAPSDEEVWLSLEDLCVRREILKVLHDANEELARFQPMEGEVAQSKLPMKRKFKSRLWELDLILDRNKNREYVFSGNLKNISGRRLQIREIKFNVWTQPDLSSTERSRPVMFTVFHEALGAEEVLKLAESKVTINQPPTGLFRVEQVLDARTVPIKRLTNLTLGQNAGHRMADRKLLMAKVSQPKAGDKPGDTTGSGAMDNPMRGKGSMQGPPPGTGDGPVGMSSGADRRSGGGLGGLGGLGGSQDVDRTTHGVVKSRYIDLTDQVRRMPVALVVTIDQVNVPDLLVTLENTPRMRFQLTQYHWQRIHGGMTSAAPGGSPSSGMGSGAMSRPSASDSRSDPRMNSPMGAGLGAGGGGAARPGTSPDTSAHAAAFLENEQNTVSLVDLTVYGIVNVYERPKDAKPAETPATPPAPTAPGPPASDTKPAGVRPADAKPATTNAAEPKSATRSGDAQTAPSPPALPPEPKESDKPKEAGPPAGSPTPPKAPGDKDAPKKQ